MSERLQSLLTPAERQLSLLPASPDSPPEIVERLEAPLVRGAPPEHTAARMYRQRPEDYRRVVAYLSEGIPVERIARALRVGVGTIYAIRRREMPDLDARKRAMADRMEEVALSAVEAANEALQDPERRAKMSAKDAAITAAILVDKAGQLRGDAAVRVELDIRAPAHDDLMREAAAIGFQAGCGAAVGVAAVAAAIAAGAGGGGRASGPESSASHGT